MTQVGLAHNSYLGFGVEAAYNTAATRNKFIEFISESIEFTKKRISSNSLQQRKRLLNRQRDDGNRSTGGSISTESMVNGQLFIWKAAFGGLTSALKAGSTLAYEHIITPAEVLPSHTVEAGRDKGIFVYPGVKFKTLQIAGKKDDAIILSFDLLGSGVEDIIDVPTPVTYPVDNLMWICDDFEFVVDEGEPLAISDFNIKADNQLIETLYRNKIRYDLAEGKPVFTGELSTDFSDTVEYQKFKSGAPASLIITGTGRLIEAEIYEQIKIEIPNLLYNGKTPTVGGAGVIGQKLPFDAYATSTTPEVKVTITSKETAA